MKNKTICLALITVTFLLTCCQNSKTENKNGTSESSKTNNINPKDYLVGEFALVPNGKAIMRISKKNDDYFLQYIDESDNDWEKPTQLLSPKDSDIEILFGTNWKDYVEVGLKDHSGYFTTTIYKLKKKYKSKDHTFETGYVLDFMEKNNIYKVNKN